VLVGDVPYFGFRLMASTSESNARSLRHYYTEEETDYIRSMLLKNPHPTGEEYAEMASKMNVTAVSLRVRSLSVHDLDLNAVL
jgi:hypothetical protein